MPRSKRYYSSIQLLPTRQSLPSRMRKREKLPKAFVVLRAGHGQQQADELMAWVNGKLATYKHVREIAFIDTIPRNPSGKILRRVLKEQERQRMGL